VAAERRQRDKAAPKTPILKSQRTPKNFRNPTVKTDRRLSRDSANVAEFVNTPIRLEDLAIDLSDEEAQMLDGLRLPVHGADDGAALRDILFTWWEQKFLGAAESGAGDWRQEGVRRRGQESKLSGLVRRRPLWRKRMKLTLSTRYRR
jgi:hypothetical protein